MQKYQTAIERVVFRLRKIYCDGDHDDDAYYDYDDDETNKSNSKIYLPENMEVNG